MRYLLLIYADELHERHKPEAEMRELIDAYARLIQDLREAGRLIESNALHPSSAATSVRVRDGQVLMSDGPFAETKEQLGGYYLIEADDLAEAVRWAARIPTAREWTIEIRPVMTFSPLP